MQKQYIAFSGELDTAFKGKGRTVASLTAAIEKCKSKNILRDYLTVRE